MNFPSEKLLFDVESILTEQQCPYVLGWYKKKGDTLEIQLWSGNTPDNLIYRLDYLHTIMGTPSPAYVCYHKETRSLVSPLLLWW